VITTNGVVDLLSAVTAYDNRNATPATILAWTEAGNRARWTYQEALDAVHAHYAESTEFVMPAHVTARIRARRQDAALRAEGVRQLEAGPARPAAAARIKQITDELAQQMGWIEEGQSRTGFALKVACPHCRAAVGERCVSSATGRALRNSPAHDSRVTALAEFLRESG
jgi:hypothetical protein